MVACIRIRLRLALFEELNKLSTYIFFINRREEKQVMTTVTERVRKIVMEQLGVKEFETEIPDEKAEKITTIQEAIDYIESNMDKE